MFDIGDCGPRRALLVDVRMLALVACISGKPPRARSRPCLRFEPMSGVRHMTRAVAPSAGYAAFGLRPANREDDRTAPARAAAADLVVDGNRASDAFEISGELFRRYIGLGGEALRAERPFGDKCGDNDELRFWHVYL